VHLWEGTLCHSNKHSRCLLHFVTTLLNDAIHFLFNCLPFLFGERLRFTKTFHLFKLCILQGIGSLLKVLEGTATLNAFIHIINLSNLDHSLFKLTHHLTAGTHTAQTTFTS